MCFTEVSWGRSGAGCRRLGREGRHFPGEPQIERPQISSHGLGQLSLWTRAGTYSAGVGWGSAKAASRAPGSLLGERQMAALSRGPPIPSLLFKTIVLTTCSALFL